MSILHSPQAPGLRLFNMQESPKVETFGPALNQVGRRNCLKYFRLKLRRSEPLIFVVRGQGDAAVLLVHDAVTDQGVMFHHGVNYHDHHGHDCK